MEFTQVQEKRCSTCGEIKLSNEFYVSRTKKDGLHNRCKPCQRAYSAAYASANRERLKAKDREYYHRNRNVKLAKNAEYRAKPGHAEIARQRAAQWRRDAAPGRHVAQNAAWRKANPGKYNAQIRARQAAKVNASPGWADHAAMAQLYTKAKEWSEILGVELHVDHCVPLRSPTVCGLHCEANLQLLAAEDNLSKGNRYWPDMPDGYI